MMPLLKKTVSFAPSGKSTSSAPSGNPNSSAPSGNQVPSATSGDPKSMEKKMQEALEELYRHLNDDKVKKIILSGEPGLGKTWMSRMVCDRAMSEGKFEVCLWLFLNQKYDRDAVYDCIARQLSVLPESDAWEVEDDNKEAKEESHSSQTKQEDGVEKKTAEPEAQKEEEKDEKVKKEAAEEEAKRKQEEAKRKGELKKKIQEALKDKKLLLVLDDEGSATKEREIMEKLQELLPKVEDASKTLITKSIGMVPDPDGTSSTHDEAGPSEDQVKVMSLKPFSAEQVQETLCSLVGYYKSPEVKNLAESFVQRSKKLPADIIALAKALKHFGEATQMKDKLLLFTDPSDNPLDKPESVKEKLESLATDQSHNALKLLKIGFELQPSSILFDSCAFGKHFLRQRSVHYSELITYWMLEGYLGEFGSIEKAFEKGHNVLMELIDCGVLKQQEYGYVTMTEAKFELNGRDLREFIDTVHLGLSTLSKDDVKDPNQEKKDDAEDRRLGNVALADGMIKSLDRGDKQKGRVSTLLLDAKRLNTQVPDDFSELVKQLKVLVFFNPAFSEQFLLPLPMMTQLRMLVLRDSDFLESIQNAIKFKVKIPDPSDSDENQDDLPLTVCPKSEAENPEMSVDTSDILEPLPCLSVLEISRPSSTKGETPMKFWLPDSLFDYMVNLQNLNLSYLQFKKLPESFPKLTKLVWLVLRGCSKLERLDSLKDCVNLEVIDLSGATSFEGFSDKSLAKNEKLRVLNLSDTLITRVPLVNSLKSLTHILLSGCKKLARSRKMEALENLQIFDVSGATDFTEFYDQSLEKLVNLEVIDASKTSVSVIPLDISTLNLYLRGCEKLEELPEIDTLKKLEVLDASGSKFLKKIHPVLFDNLTSLRELNLSRTGVTSLPSFSKLCNLRRLLLSKCQSLRKLEGLSSASKLEELDLSWSEAFDEIEEDSFKKMSSLEKLDLSGTKITCLPSLPNPSSLRQLLLKKCAQLKVDLRQESLSSLEELNLSRINSGEGIDLGFLKDTTKLRILDISNNQVIHVGSLKHLTSLTYLSLRGCGDLDEEPDLKQLTKLESLDLSGTSVQNLTVSKNFRQLRQLLVDGQALNFEEKDILPFLADEPEPNKELQYRHISDLTRLERIELSEMRTQGADDANPELDRCQWSVSSWWPAESVTKRNKPVISVNRRQFGKLFENKFSPSEKRLHFSVQSMNDGSWRRLKFEYTNELFFTDVYLYPQLKPIPNSMPQKSLEISGFDSCPDDLRLVLAKAEFVFLMDNSFLRCLSELGSESLRKVKACWIEGCNEIEHALDMEKAEVTDKSEGMAAGTSGQGGEMVEAPESNGENLEKAEVTDKTEEMAAGTSDQGGEMVEVPENIGENLEILWHRNAIHLKSICTGKLRSNAFTKLRHLYLENCIELLYVCPSSVHLLNQLEVLQVRSCPKLASLFEGDRGKLEKLHKLQLWGLPELKDIAYEFTSLKTLEVGDCPMLENVISSSQIPRNLEILRIKFCEEVKTAFKSGGGTGVTLRQLEELHLCDLPKLEGIGANLPRPKKHVVLECPNWKLPETWHSS